MHTSFNRTPQYDIPLHRRSNEFDSNKIDFFEYVKGQIK